MPRDPRRRARRRRSGSAAASTGRRRSPRARSATQTCLKAELFQKTGSFKARGVLNKLASLTPEEKARGVIGISAGNHAQALAWGAALEGIDCLVVMYASASAGEGRGDAWLRRRRSTSRPPTPSRRSPRLDEHIRETGRTLVHPVRRPARDRRPGHARARAARGRARGRDDPRADRRRRARRRRRRGGARPARRSRSSRSARPRCTTPSRRAVRARDAGLDRRRPLRARSPARQALAVLQAHGVESMLVTEEEIEEAFRFLYDAREARVRAGRSGGCRGGPGRAGRETARSAAVVSGGNVAAETASAILARR